MARRPNLGKTAENPVQKKATTKELHPGEMTEDTGDIRKTGAFKKLMGTLRGKDPKSNPRQMHPAQRPMRVPGGTNMKSPC